MTLRRHALRLGMWSSVLQLAKVGINGATFVILARWLSVQEIGIFGTAFAVLSIVQIPVKMGVMEMMIREEQGSDKFFSTCYWLSLAIGAAAMAAMLFAAATAQWLGQTDLSWYLLCFCVIPLLEAAAIVPEAMLRRNLKFRSLAVRTLIGVTIASAIALGLAHFGYGRIALMSSTAVGSLLSALLAMAIARWRPKALFSLQIAIKARAGVLQIIMAGFASASIVPISQFLVGVIAGPTAAGAYVIAQRIVVLLNNMAIEPARLVILPIMSGLRRRSVDRSTVLREAAMFLASVMSPLYFGFMSLSEPILRIIISDKANLVQPISFALCFSFIPQIVSMLVTQTLTADNLSDRVLRFTGMQFVANLLLSALLSFVSPLAVGIGYSARAYALLPFVIRAGDETSGVSYNAVIRGVLSAIPAGALLLALSLLVKEGCEAYGIGDLPTIAAIALTWALLYLPLFWIVSPSAFKKIRSDIGSLLPQTFRL